MDSRWTDLAQTLWDLGMWRRRTERGREIVTVVAEGLTNDEIAARLLISLATARTHVGRAMVKLGAQDRAQLVVFAFQSGLAE